MTNLKEANLALRAKSEQAKEELVQAEKNVAPLVKAARESESSR